jgi:hypothetical protein
VARQTLLGFEITGLRRFVFSRCDVTPERCSTSCGSVWAPLPVCFALVAASFYKISPCDNNWSSLSVGIQGRTRPSSTNCSGSPLGRSGPIGSGLSSSSVPKPLFSGTDPDLSCTGVFCPELGAHAVADAESRRRFALRPSCLIHATCSVVQTARCLYPCI